MKKILYIGYILIILAMLLGCTSQKHVENNLIKNKLVIDQISNIEIEVDNYKKVITSQDEIDLLISYIEGIQILGRSLENIKSREENKIVRIKLYNKTGNMFESISIAEEITYYNKKWYPTGINTYDKIRTLYKNIVQEEIENDNLLNIVQRRDIRKEKQITESLQGIWLNENETTIKFNNIYLMQGQLYNYIFKYNINKTYDNSLDISIYGINGLFIKGKELSNIYIKMDPTKTHMIMNTIMAGGVTHYDKLVYVDKDGLRLGSFDSYFFLENSFE